MSDVFPLYVIDNQRYLLLANMCDKLFGMLFLSGNIILLNVEEYNWSKFIVSGKLYNQSKVQCTK